MPEHAELSYAELESRLRDKEQLVGALTERLEEAARQLDRFRRSGADRASHAAGLPGEVAEQHRNLLERLASAVERWEDVQAADVLERLDAQVGDIHEFLVGSGRNGLMLPDADRSESQDAPSPSAATGGEPSSAWEALKAEILAGDPVARGSADAADAESASEQEPAAPPPQLAEAPETPDDVSAAVDEDEPVEDASAIEIPEAVPPEPIDVDAVEPDVLREAVAERDAYITFLTARLRAAEISPMLPSDWSQLADVPDELRQKTQELSERLEEHLRLAEVEFSLERARLGRLQSQLELQEQQLDKKQARLDRKRNDENGVEETPRHGDGEASSPGLWRRLFG